MQGDTDPRFSWLSRWPHDQVSVAGAWASVHTRFGFAAQAGGELETALVMIVSQSQQIIEQHLSFEDLLEYLEANGTLTLGKLVVLFSQIHEVSDELRDVLEIAVKKRNYLIHHFYRNRAELFYSPEGCKQLEDELISIQNDLSAATEQLGYWMDSFGARSDGEIWDEIRGNVEKMALEQDAMLKAII